MGPDSMEWPRKLSLPHWCKSIVPSQVAQAGAGGAPGRSSLCSVLARVLQWPPLTPASCICPSMSPHPDLPQPSDHTAPSPGLSTHPTSTARGPACLSRPWYLVQSLQQVFQRGLGHTRQGQRWLAYWGARTAVLVGWPVLTPLVVVTSPVPLQVALSAHSSL